MSHDHYLECRACGKKADHDCFRHYVNVSNGDVAVQYAFAVRALVEAGVPFEDRSSQWVRFIAKHAACNAFYEVCSYQPYSSPCIPDERIEVQGATSPPCTTCSGRRLVPCPDCKEGS